jgi:hypothetical protein
MANYRVTARWAHGLWELEVLGVGVTQSATAEGAEEIVRDYLDCLGFTQADVAPITIAWNGTPVIDARTSEDIIGYDENGLPE